jgi:hypothetical protein
MPRRAGRLAAVGLMTVAILGGCGADVAQDDVAQNVVNTISVGGCDRYPSSTPADWVTYADHVIVATATSERVLPLDKDVAENGEGDVDRTVTLRPDEILWSAESPRQDAPTESFEFAAFGWALRQDGTRTPLARDGAPRLEVGHTYIIALSREPEVDDEPTPIPAHWVTLGGESMVPYDQETIGTGEGAEVTADDAGEDTVEHWLAGEHADALVTLLNSTEPDLREF